MLNPSTRGKLIVATGNVGESGALRDHFAPPGRMLSINQRVADGKAADLVKRCAFEGQGGEGRTIPRPGPR